jgi:hypothetical protein
VLERLELLHLTGWNSLNQMFLKPGCGKINGGNTRLVLLELKFARAPSFADKAIAHSLIIV